MPDSSSLTLSIGDRVVYPNQGLCTVTDIKTEEIAGHSLTFVSLVFSETGARVKVPQEKLVKNGVRRVAGSDEVKRVFEFLRSDSERASLDWKKRARDNTLRLSEGGVLGLAEVVKGLQVLSELRPLPPKERGQYNDARHLLVTELAAGLGVSDADAEDALDIVLSPVGKERPKRSVEEFQGLGDEDDELGLGGDLLGLGDTEAEAEDAAEPEAAEALESSEASGSATEDAGEEAAPPAKARKPAAAAKPAKAAAAPRKPGRPPKEKPEEKAKPKAKAKAEPKKAPAKKAAAPKAPAKGKKK